MSASAAAGGAAAVDADDEASLCGALFRGLVFFLGREVPREALLLVIRCADMVPALLSTLRTSCPRGWLRDRVTLCVETCPDLLQSLSVSLIMLWG